MLSAAASLGMILLWDVDGGLTQIDKYLYSSEDYIKVGGAAFLAWHSHVTMAMGTALPRQKGLLSSPHPAWLCCCGSPQGPTCPR